MTSIVARVSALTIPQTVITTTSMLKRQHNLSQPCSGLISLAPEIVACILKSCSILSRINLALTCKHLATIAIVSSTLTFDTSLNSPDRKLILRDDSLHLHILTVEGYDEANNDFTDITFSGCGSIALETSECVAYCTLCNVLGNGPTLSHTMKIHVRKHIETQGGLATQGVMALLDWKMSILQCEWEAYLNNRAFTTLKYRKDQGEKPRYKSTSLVKWGWSNNGD